MMEVNPNYNGDEPAQTPSRSFLAAYCERLAAIPGVESVGSE